ncbi:hypothetical protein GRF29_44g2237488 [Pseudopithomyces chartarum]|uniref:Amidohydrolase-related domain-containing protein n=1 Tax=Pseudopithomyces chartarum TaxID=1892770 RepID=A0AAN6M2Z9_9PLEO|nr:hypothetical protein GRF29_44g2237488 [Pseudopithomyces chartarum]
MWSLVLLLSSVLAPVDAASLLFTDATIISYDFSTNHTQILRDSSLLVQGDRIVELYNGTTPSSYPNDTTVVNATGKIISPGFINTHHHLWQTGYKTLASNTTLAQYFQRYGEFGPSIQHMTAEDKYLAQIAGALELVNTGTTTILDHASGDSSEETEDSILQATLESGVRIFHAFSVHDLGTATNWTVDLQIQKLRSLATDPRLTNNSLVNLGLSFDAFPSAPKSQIEELWSIVRDNDLSLVTTHHLAGPYLNDNSPTLLDSLGWLNTSTPVIFSHSSFISSSDIHVLRQRNQYISATPESEMHYGHGNMYSHLIQDQASLGVDTHFTFSADMVQQARLWLQNLRLRLYEKVLKDLQVPWNNPMTTEQAFHLITRAGALALRRDDLGVIVPGAKADLAIFNADTPNLLGAEYDPVAAIILHSNTGDVEDVVVGGEFVKREGKILYEGYGEVKRRFRESARKIQRVWSEMEWENYWEDSLFLGVTEYGTAEEIDTQRG